MNFKTLLSIAAIAAVTQVTGCTMVPVTTNLDVPVAKTASATGPAVKIVSVTDNRKFVYPHEAGDCETPSVENEKMLGDADARARSFGRQGRCDGGEWANHAMVMLPEGERVSKKIQSSVEEGLRRSGYRVAPNDPNAIPVRVALNNFWVTFSLDGMGMRYSYVYDINIDTQNGSEKYQGQESEKMYFAAGSKWSKYAQEGLEHLSAQLAEKPPKI